MFLAVREMKYQKGRYIPVIAVVALIAYLVFVLTSLAYGLSSAFRSEIDRWKADRIVLTKSANGNLFASMITEPMLQGLEIENKAFVNLFPTTVYTSQNKTESTAIKTVMAGCDRDGFLMPDCIEGRQPIGAAEVLVSLSLHEEESVQLGDLLYPAQKNEPLTVTGFTADTRFSVAPIVYTALEDAVGTYAVFGDLEKNNPEIYQIAMAGMPKLVNAVVVRGSVRHLPPDLEAIPVRSFIWKLPGYAPQLLTFTFMIVFLMLITTVIIAIFMFILTLQKKSIFGVMKAQGVPEFMITRSVLIQSFLLTGFGGILGLIFALLTQTLLPPAVPFRIHPLFYLSALLLLFFSSLFGSFFSVRMVRKIDPLEVIQ